MEYLSDKTGPLEAPVRQALDAIYQAESRRILATLIRLLGDFNAAEDAMHDAFAAAAEQWPREGIPANPRAWLVSTGRFKAIDAIRRRSKMDSSFDEAVEGLEAETPDPADLIDKGIEDDELRLIFTCCHPALAAESRIALTLREVCGLTTEEIARAFLTTPPTIAQRIVRAKSKIREARIPYEMPPQSELKGRLEAVLHVIYLVFNEGYSATSGDVLIRADLSAEAIRLGRLLKQLLPEPEVIGLLALMLLQESRRSARTAPDGGLVLLEDQDRGLWNRELIAEGTAFVEQALSTRKFGPYSIQAAIAAVHAQAAQPSETDWSEITALYDILLREEPSPVVELNRAVAIAMRDGPAAGIALIEQILAKGELSGYHLAHSALAELHRRVGNKAKAENCYKKALALARQEPERRFLEQRLREL